ncbi:CGNR zinc finger domain-containing protein [Pseudomonas syringae]|uniref:CGNR zinc finger domain-containing protein n=1 Tax=Pseudomonas syringae TaxID=317 RepID=UPI003F756E48
MKIELETLRAVANTFSISHETREFYDELPELLLSEKSWFDRFGQFPNLKRNASRGNELARVRDSLRRFILREEGADARLSELFVEKGLHIGVVTDDSSVTATVIASADGDASSYLLIVAANLIIRGEIVKLKICPDCRCVFIDNTRNSSKRWCGMTKGGVNGRACGTIAKVKAFRSRKAAAK